MSDQQVSAHDPVLKSKIPQEFGVPNLAHEEIGQILMPQGVSAERILGIVIEESGTLCAGIDHSPRGLEKHIEKLKGLGLKLGEPYSIIDEAALEESRYDQVAFIAVIPILVRDGVTVPYVVGFDRNDNLSDKLIARINSEVEANLQFAGPQIVREKEYALREARAARQRWAGLALGAVALFGGATAVYQAMEPVGAIVSNWKQDRVAGQISDLVRVNEYLKLDSSNRSATLAPITAHHYQSLAQSINVLSSDAKANGEALDNFEKMELLVSVAKQETWSGRDLPNSSKSTQAFFKEVFEQLVVSAPNSELRATAADALFFVNHPDGPPVRSTGVWASLKRYFSSSERAEQAAKVVEVATIDKFISLDASAIGKTLKPITIEHYRALRDSFSPDADPVKVGDQVLSEQDRVELLKRMMDHEISVNRWIDGWSSTDTIFTDRIFKDLFRQVLTSCSSHEARAVAAEALHQLETQ